GGVLRSRMAHYAAEKRFLAEKFAGWLKDHIEHLMDDDKRRVAVFVDAGSSNLWFCRYFWEHVAKLSKQRRPGCELRFITNSVPVAESYAEADDAGDFSSDTPVSLALLSGSMQAKYGALVDGGTTPSTLQSLIRRKNQTAKWWNISLSAGNFVRLEFP